MPKKKPEEQGKHVQTIRWLVWECTRLYEPYRRDLEQQLLDWETIAKGRRYSGTFEKDQRILAARKALRRYENLQDIASEMPKGHFDLPLQKCEVYFFRRYLSGEISRAVKGRSVTAAGKKEADCLPELAPFRKKWGLRFPLPPELQLPRVLDLDLLDIESARPVTILRDVQDQIVLRITPVISKNLTFDFIEGAILTSPYVERTQEGGIIAKNRADSARPVIGKLSDGTYKATVPLPLHRSYRKYLSVKVPDGLRLREVQEAVVVARLKAKGVGYGKAVPLVYPGQVPDEDLRDRVKKRHKTFTSLQRRLIDLVP